MRKLMSFRLTTIFVALIVVGVALAFFVNPPLAHLKLLDFLKENDVANSSESPKNLSSIDLLRKRIFGESSMKVIKTIKLENTVIDRERADALCQSSIANKSIVDVKLFRVELDGASNFLSEFHSLAGLNVINSQLPAGWIGSLGENKNLRVVRIYSAENLPIEELRSLSQLEYLILQGNAIRAEDLISLRKNMANTHVLANGSAIEEFRALDTARKLSLQPPSKVNLLVQSELNEAVQQFKNLLSQNGVLVGKRFQSPASEEDISDLEFVLGQPLPAELRAWLSISNGQTGPSFWSDREGMCEATGSDLSIASLWLLNTFSHELTFKEFISDLYPVGDPERWNPKNIPFAGNHTTAVVRPQNEDVFSWSAEGGNFKISDSFRSYFTKSSEHLLNGNFSNRGKNNVSIDGL